MAKLNKDDIQLLLKRGVRANLNVFRVAGLGVQGEPAYTTDTKQLFVHDGTGFVPIQSLDMAVMFEGEIVSFNNEIVYNY